MDDTHLPRPPKAGSKPPWVPVGESLTRAQIDGAEDKVIAWTAGGNDRKIKGNDYLQQFALPNFFFFVTTAYNILRHRGVPLGKRDFLGPVNWL